MYIRCEDKLHRYFPNLDSEPGLAELKKINFDKQTLLIGRAYYAHDAEISYRIALDLNNDKTGRDNCTLYVTIKGDEVPKEEGFIWGCIVNRILPDTDVHFEITKE